MKTTVEALKGLYTAVGGTDDVKSISTVEDMLGKITEALGGDMPKGVLTTADAISKVAEVATGGGGGGGIDYVPVTISNTATFTVYVTCLCLQGDGTISVSSNQINSQNSITAYAVKYYTGDEYALMLMMGAQNTTYMSQLRIAYPENPEPYAPYYKGGDNKSAMEYLTLLHSGDTITLSKAN